MNPLDVLIAALMCWRLAYLVTREDAPFALMRRIRERTTLGGLLTCIKCATLWTAALAVFLLPHPADIIGYGVYVVAVSGAALMLASYTGAGHG